MEPYKPTVMWDDDQPHEPQTYATMERPHLYFDAHTGRATHLGVASTLNMGDTGCPNSAPLGRKCKDGACACASCKYVSHAGSLLIALA